MGSIVVEALPPLALEASPPLALDAALAFTSVRKQELVELHDRPEALSRRALIVAVAHEPGGQSASRCIYDGGYGAYPYFPLRKNRRDCSSVRPWRAPR